MSPVSPSATSYSTAFAVKTDLFNRMTADTAIGAAPVSPTGVFWAKPNYDHGYYEVLYFTETQNQIDFASLGLNTLNRDETMRVTLRLVVLRDGTDAQAAEQTWWTIEQAIENILLVDYQTAGDSWGHLSDYAMSVDTASDGIVVSGDLSITVHNRLR